jgi:glutaredoxin-related protein
MKKIVLIIVIMVVGLVAFGYFSNKKAMENSQVAGAEIEKAPLIFFYGKGCPHCENVEEYFKKNKVEEKIKFHQVEVWGNKANQKIMVEKAKQCGIAEDNLGVPLLWSDGKCFSGDKDIIQFFNDKLNTKDENK